MKIGILTQPLHNNYGGILQNYALQTVIKRFGHEVVTIDIQYPNKNIPISTRIVKYIWRMLKWFCGDRNILYFDLKQQLHFLNTSGKEQTRFIDSHITVEHYGSCLNKDYCNDNKYDAFVVGSDQVWRPRFSPYIPNYFLDFTEGMQVKRISYAASFGTDCWEDCSLSTSRLASLAKLFDAISVREKTGVRICKDTFGVDATWVLDPTLLLSVEDYKELYKDDNNTRKYVAVYILDESQSTKTLVNEICKKLKTEPLFLGIPTKNGYPSIESWLCGIFKSQFVITDSFHGTVFSILGHKQFATIVNAGRGASRFESLLGSLNLIDRIVADNYNKVLSDIIDYTSVDSLLVEYRKNSLEFLKQALDGNK